jgi:uncharacterized protein
LGVFLVALVRRSARSLYMEEPQSIVEHLIRQLLDQTGHGAGPAERKSWLHSLPEVAALLRDAELDGVEVLLEYPLPLTSRRADVILAGANPHTGAPSYVVLELKQWSAARVFEGDPSLVTVSGMPGPPKLHAVRQVRGYVDYLSDYLKVLHDQPDALGGAAWLHNALVEGAVRELHHLPGDTRGRLFTGADRAAMLAWLRPDSCRFSVSATRGRDRR